MLLLSQRFQCRIWKGEEPALRRDTDFHSKILSSGSQSADRGHMCYHANTGTYGHLQIQIYMYTNTVTVFASI